VKLIISSTLTGILLLPLAACSQSGSQPGVSDNGAPADGGTTSSIISGEIQKRMREAKQELETKNIDVNSVRVSHGSHSEEDSRPKAQITPQGDLLIAGKVAAATPAQKTLLLNYRRQIVSIAETGMDIGTQGADLGISAARQAMLGALAGKSDKDVEASIKPQTDKIKASAARLCQRLPDLLSTQQRLAAAMPAFQPYATMQQKDIDDCGKDMKNTDGRKGFAVFSD
jgi:hypothetical protein